MPEFSVSLLSASTYAAGKHAVALGHVAYSKAMNSYTGFDYLCFWVTVSHLCCRGLSVGPDSRSLDLGSTISSLKVTDSLALLYGLSLNNL